MNIIDKIHHAINKINPNAQITISADKDATLDNVNIIFHNCNPIPKEEIRIKIIELEAEYNSNQYQRDRASAYPSLADQLDMQYWDKINGTNKWQQAINAVKQKYPK